jgi:hypothetical protein
MNNILHYYIHCIHTRKTNEGFHLGTGFPSDPSDNLHLENKSGLGVDDLDLGVGHGDDVSFLHPHQALSLGSDTVFTTRDKAGFVY